MAMRVPMTMRKGWYCGVQKYGQTKRRNAVLSTNVKRKQSPNDRRRSRGVQAMVGLMFVRFVVRTFFAGPRVYVDCGKIVIAVG